MMRKNATKISTLSMLLLVLFGFTAKAQNATDNNSTEFKPHGQLWGYAFGDWAFKGNTDDVNGGRGGTNQYTKVPKNYNGFQFRRIYLGYDYEISKKFVAEFLLAAEDNFSGGDLLTDGKFSPYVKLADIRWRNIFKNSDLLIGQAPTPAFPMGQALSTYARNTQTPEEVWAYRSVERTVTDIRRTPSFDFGVALQGWFDNKGRFGYDVMVGNGGSAKPETDMFKWFYGDVYAKFFNKRLIIDFYQDYERLNWNPIVDGQAETATTTGGVTTYSAPSPAGLHHDRRMSKLFVAWQDKKFTVGVEAFMNTIMGDVQAIDGTTHKAYYRTSKSMAISTYVTGRIYKDKLGFFARYDNYNPSLSLKEVTDNANFTSYNALTGTYDPTTKEQFVTLGLDYTPFPKVHIMPNIWMNTYNTALSTGDYKMNPYGSGAKGTDMVYRITFYYIYGK